MDIQWQWANAKMYSLPVFFIQEILGPVSDAIYSANICLIINNNIQTQRIRLLRCFTMKIDTMRTGDGGWGEKRLIVGIKVLGKKMNVNSSYTRVYTSTCIHTLLNSNSFFLSFFFISFSPDFTIFPHARFHFFFKNWNRLKLASAFTAPPPPPFNILNSLILSLVFI